MHPTHHGQHATHGHGIRFAHGFHSALGGRARRGDVQPAVLALLGERPMHGYQIIQELAERTGGAWTPSPGSIYPILKSLEDQGLVTSEKDGGRRVFSLTMSGAAEAEALSDRSPWDGIVAESDPARRLRETFHGLMAATTQVGRAGAPEQIERAAEILDHARKEMYRLLAGSR